MTSRSDADYLVLRTLALDDWEEALDTYTGDDASDRWELECLRLAGLGFLEPLFLANRMFPPLKTYRLTAKGWKYADYLYGLRFCVWCKPETGALCRACKGSGFTRSTSSCAHSSPACDECVAHDTLCAMSS